MSRPWWVRRLFATRPRPAARLQVHRLEDRTTPALAVGYAGGALSLLEVSAGADNVVVSEPAAGQVQLTLLGGATFAAGSTTAPGFTYQTPGDPAASAFVVVDVATAGGVTSFTLDAGLGADAAAVAVPTVPLGAVRLTLDQTADSILNVAGAVAAGFDAAAETVTVSGPPLTSTGGQPVRLLASGPLEVSAVVTADGDLESAGDAAGRPGVAGVLITGGSLTATGAGSVRVTGAGGTGSGGRGVAVTGGATVRAAGSGAVTLTGTGRGTAGGSDNAGVLVGAGSKVSAASGVVTLTGVGGAGPNSAGVSVAAGGSVTADTGGVVTAADAVDLLGPVTAATTIGVRPLTAGTLIDLGGPDAPGTLGLTAVELLQLFAPTVRVGTSAADAGLPLAGNLVVSAPVVATPGTGLTLLTGGTLGITAGVTVDAGETLTLTADGEVRQTAGALVAGTLRATSATAGVFLGDRDADLQVPPGVSTAFANAVGTVTASAAGDFTLTAVGPLTLAGATAGGRVTVAVGPGAALSVTQPVTAATGNLSLYADDMDLQAALSAPAFGGPDAGLVGTVQLLTSFDSVGVGITLGGAAAGTLSLTPAELALTAGRLVQIGDARAGTVRVAGPVAFTRTGGSGFNTLVLGAGGAVTQDPGAGLSVDSLAVAPGTGPVTLAATDAGGTPLNNVRVFAAFGGGADVAFATQGDLFIARVGLIAGVSGQTVSVTAAGSLTVNVPEVPPGSPAAPFAVRGAAAAGTLTLAAGLNLVVDSSNTVAGLAATNLLVGQKAAGTLVLAGSSLPAASPTTLTGGAGNDTFNLTKGSATSPVTVDGGPPVRPAPTIPPGDTLNYFGGGPGLVVTYTGQDSGFLSDAGVLPVTFTSIETLVPGGTVTQVVGTAGDDYVVLYRDGGGSSFYQFSADAGATFSPPVQVNGTAFQFFGQAGRDVLKVDYTRGADPLAPLPGGVQFDGGAGTDLLSLFGTGGFQATYTPTAAGAGTVAVTGGAADRQVTFTTADELDLTGFGQVTVRPAGATDTLTVADGTNFLPDALVPAVAALRVGGTSGGFAVVPAAVWNNNTLLIDAPGAGSSVTIPGAAGGHANRNLTVVSETITVAGNVAVAETVRFTNSGVLTLGVGSAVTVSGGTGVFQDGAGPVVLGKDATLESTLGPVDVLRAVDGGFALTATAPAGAVRLRSGVGAGVPLARLTVTGAQILLDGADYKTTGPQAFNGPVTVGRSVTFTATNVADGDVRFAGTLNGATVGGQAVAVNAAGTTTFGGVVGGTVVLIDPTSPTVLGGVPLAILTTGGGGTTVVAGGAVTTTAGQGFGDAVVLGKNTEFTSLNALAAGGGVTFDQTLDSAGDGAFGASVRTYGGGPTTFRGAVGGAADGALAFLTTDASGLTVVAGGLVRTTGGQGFADRVFVDGSTVTAFRAGGDVTFSQRLDAIDPAGNGVVVTTPATTTFGSPVGGDSPLAFLVTDGGGTTDVQGGAVTTTGGQGYGDAVRVTGFLDGGFNPLNVVFTSLNPLAAGGGVTFDSTLDARDTTGLLGLRVPSAGVTVNTPGGGVTRFRGPVGAGVGADGLPDGALAFLRTDAPGSTFVDGGLVVTVGDQTYADRVLAPGDVTFRSVDAATGQLVGTGDIRFLFDGSSGGGGPALRAGGTVTIQTAGAVTFEGGVVAAGLVVAGGGRTDLNARDTAIDTGTGPQTYTGDVVLTDDTVLVAGAVLFGGRVDADGVANWTLDVLGGATFTGQVGGADLAGVPGRQPLGRLTVTGPTAVNGGLVRTVPRAERLVAPGFVIPATAGDQLFFDAVTVSRDTLFVSAGAGTGPIEFGGTLDSAVVNQLVRVTTAGPTRFLGAVGASGRLGGLTTDGGGVTAVAGGGVRTATIDIRDGGQLFADDVLVAGGAATFQADQFGTGRQDVTFAGRLDAQPGNSPDVTVRTPGLATFNGPVGGVLPLGSLAVGGVTDFSGVTRGSTAVNGGLVAVERSLDFNVPAVLGTDTTFVAGTTASFNRLDAATPGGAAATVNAAGVTRFRENVGGTAPLATLATDAPGTVEFLAVTVRTVGDQTFNDRATVAVRDSVFVSDAGTVRFANTLDGPGSATVTAAAGVAFGGAVGRTVPLASLTVAGGSPAAVNGGGVRTTGGQRFTGPVTVGAVADFDSQGGGVRFDRTLAGPVPVRVFSPAETVFGGDVDLADLQTDRFGTTTVAAGRVAVAADVRFGDPVTVTAPVLTVVAGRDVTFEQSLSGTATRVVVNAPATTRFAGPVSVGSLATDPGVLTAFDGLLVETAGSQTYAEPVVVGTDMRFQAGGGVRFGVELRSNPPGSRSVFVNAAGDTEFLGGVSVGRLTTDAPGATRVAGGAVRTVDGQLFLDPVTVTDRPAAFVNTTSGTVEFARTLDGPQAATVTAAGDTLFRQAVGGTVPLAALTLDGGGRSLVFGGLVRTTGPQTYLDAVRVIGPDTTFAGGRIDVAADLGSPPEEATTLRLTADAGVGQSGGRTTAAALVLGGRGVFSLDQPANDFRTLDVGLGSGSQVFLSDANALSLVRAVAPGGTVRLRTGTDFSAAAGVPLNVGDGQFVVAPGLSGPAAVLFRADATARQVVLGVPGTRLDETSDLAPNKQTKQPPPFPALPLVLPAEPVGTPAFPPGANTGSDTFTVRLQPTAPVFVFGNDPRPGRGGFAPPGDVLNPEFGGKAVADFAYDGQDGFYRLGDGAVAQFRSIESLGGLSASAFVVQTGEPADGTGAATQRYAVRVVRNQNGTPLPGGLDGAQLPENPFVVSPRLVNPAASTQPPRTAFGDFGGTPGDLTRPDNVPDLVLANGPGTPPLVTVINGRALDQLRVNGQLQFENGRPVLNRIEDLGDDLEDGLILAQFYAYDPGFLGGVNVAVGKLAGPTGPASIIVGADSGGGPRVRAFNLLAAAPGGPVPLVPDSNGLSLADGRQGSLANFFAYEPSFTGGVRVAAADVTGDGTDDLILAPGAGGGPRVRVFAGEDWATKSSADNPLAGTTPAYADFFTVEESFRGGLYVAAGFYREPPVAGSAAVPGSKADIVIGAAGGGGPRVMIFDGSTLSRGGVPGQLANFFAFAPTEMNDPLFGRAGFATGVGGVAFGRRPDPNGFLDVLVSTGRGTGVRVRQFPGGTGDLFAAAEGGTETPTFTDLTTPGTTDAPALVAANGKVLSPDDLVYGASVGGFVV